MSRHGPHAFHFFHIKCFVLLKVYPAVRGRKAEFRTSRGRGQSRSFWNVSSVINQPATIILLFHLNDFLRSCLASYYCIWSKDTENSDSSTTIIMRRTISLKFTKAQMNEIRLNPRISERIRCSAKNRPQTAVCMIKFKSINLFLLK